MLFAFFVIGAVIAVICTIVVVALAIDTFRERHLYGRSVPLLLVGVVLYGAGLFVAYTVNAVKEWPF